MTLPDRLRITVTRWLAEADRYESEGRETPSLEPTNTGRALALRRCAEEALAIARPPATGAPEAPPPASLLETARKALEGIIPHARYLMMQETAGATGLFDLQAAESALAAIENYKPPPAPDEGACARALRVLVRRLDEVHADPTYRRVWEVAQATTGKQYDGPQYFVELELARAALRTAPEEREGNLYDVRRVVFKEVHDKVVELERRSGGFDLEHFCDWLAEQDGTYARETAPLAPSPTLAPEPEVERLRRTERSIRNTAARWHDLQRLPDSLDLPLFVRQLDQWADWIELAVHRLSLAPAAPAPERAVLPEVIAQARDALEIFANLSCAQGEEWQDVLRVGIQRKHIQAAAKALAALRAWPAEKVPADIAALLAVRDDLEGAAVAISRHLETAARRINLAIGDPAMAALVQRAVAEPPAPSDPDRYARGSEDIPAPNSAGY